MRPTPRPNPAASPNVTTAPPSLQTPPAAPASPAIGSMANSPPSVAPSVTTPAQPSVPATPAAPVIDTTVPATPVAPCCPDVSTFEVSSPRTVYFAFDDRTNKAAAPTGNYDNSPTDTKSLPSNKEDRDGSKWVSVMVGKTSEVVIEFLGGTAACIGNVTYNVAPATVAKVNAPMPTATGAKFTIEGLAAGEATIEVACNGTTLGWIHVWCAAEVTIAVDLCSIVSQNVVTTPASGSTPASTTTTAISRSASYVVADLEAYLNQVFNQVGVTFSVTDHGDVTIAETTTYAKTAARSLTVEALARAAKTFTGAYQMFYWVDVAPHSGGLGMVPGGVGTGRGAFGYFDHDTTGAYNTMAHELGHCLNLSHPIHDTDKDEFPHWQLARMVPHPTTGNDTNVLQDDNWNLMGYQGPVSSRGANRVDMRYRQWKKCKRS